MNATANTMGNLFTWPDPQRHRQRLNLLAAVLDSWTRRRLREAGVRRGARCLEIGAGSGSVAAWLAAQVGPSGYVVATDTTLEHLPEHPDIVRVVHDITTDPLDTLAGDGFDLVHARLVISQLPGRAAVLNKLADTLAPGGALVVEELDGAWDRYVIQTPDTVAYRLFADYHETITDVLDTAGKDLGWEVVTAMGDTGLTDVDCQMWAKGWRGGSAGCALLRDTIELPLLRNRLAESGMSDDDLDRFAALLTDPQLVAYMHPTVSVIGHRSVTAPEGQP